MFRLWNFSSFSCPPGRIDPSWGSQRCVNLFGFRLGQRSADVLVHFTLEWCGSVGICWNGQLGFSTLCWHLSSQLPCMNFVNCWNMLEYIEIYRNTVTTCYYTSPNTRAKPLSFAWPCGCVQNVLWPKSQATNRQLPHGDCSELSMVLHLPWTACKTQQTVDICRL